MSEVKEAVAENKDKAFLSVQDICYIAVFTALIAIMAQISIPLPAGVPFTLQTLAIPLAGIILGAKRGTIAAVVYVLLGAVGVPVFAGFTGGPQTIVGYTGGFIVSFPLMALTAGLVADKSIKNISFWAGLVAGAVLNYAIGTVWFMVVAKSGLAEAFFACVVPFIPTAIVKIILAGIFGNTLRIALKKASLIK